jgi:hypothetical protein
MGPLWGLAQRAQKDPSFDTEVVEDQCLTLIWWPLVDLYREARNSITQRQLDRLPRLSAAENPWDLTPNLPEDQ